jgi:CobQ-like glutamine amidotransferase family enzyme
VVFAVCAGYQIVGRSFPGSEGIEPGLDLLDVTTTVGTGPRAVGELLVEPASPLELPLISGFENHQGVTALGVDTRPLGRVLQGVGNGADHGHAATEGACADRIVATYAHGPVLARNPAFADWILAMIVGPLAPLDHDVVEATASLRRERLSAVQPRSTNAG